MKGETNMVRNISKKDHPIQFQIARLRKRCALNSEQIQLIGKGLVMISLPFAMMYASRGIEKYQKAQEKTREDAIHSYEEMPQEQKDKVWNQKQQEALDAYVKKIRSGER